MPGHLALSSLRTTAVLGLRLVTLAASLILTTRVLGPAGYGGYASAASLAVVLGLVPNLGAGYLLMARAPKDPQAPRESWRYGWPLTIGLGLLLMGPFIVVASHICGDRVQLRDLMLIATTELLATPLIALLGFLLQAQHRVAMGQVVTWLPLACRTLGASLCLLLPAWRYMHPYVASQALGALAGLLGAILLTARFADLTGKPRAPTSEELRRGSTYAAMHVVAANPAELDKVVSPLLLGASDAGIYTSASRVMGALVTPVTGMLLASQPRLFAHGADPGQSPARLIATLARLSIAWGVGSALALIIVSPWAALLFGDAFVEVVHLLPWIACAAPFICLRLTAGTILVAMGKPLERLAFELLGIGLLLPLLWLGATWRQLHGMATALVVAEAAMTALGWWRVRRWL